MKTPLKDPTGRRRTTIVVVGAFGVALLARLIYLHLVGYYYNSDSQQFYKIASNLLNHGAFSLGDNPPFGPTIRRAPIYPLFIAAAGVPSMHTMAVIQAVLGALTAVMLLFLGRIALPLPYATGAAVIYALHPGAIWMSSCILGETLYTALLVAATLLIVKSVQRQRWVWAAFAGAILGLAALIRPIALLLPLAFWLTLRLIPRVQRRTLMSATALLFAVAVVVPWTIRCTRVSGQFVMVQGCLAVNVYMAARTDWDPADESRLWDELKYRTLCGRHLAKALGADLTPAAQVAADATCGREAWALIRGNFLKWAQSRIARFPHLFINSFDNFTGLRGQSWGAVVRNRNYHALFLKLFMVSVFSVLPLLLSALALPEARNNPALALSLAVCVYTMAVHFPVWIEIRFWMPAVPFQAICAAGGLRYLTGATRSRRVSATKPAGQS